MNESTYRAFISYSHSDERWASWLHRALESYRLPRKLVGTQTSVGEIPKLLQPVFRDRDDLSSAADLSTTVKEALANSENLLVICSPASAASQWVNEEIREFVRLGRQSQIFCVIVDGDPASTEPGVACFPAALAEAGLHEPLAADVRKWADGKYLAKLKLVAGMLALPLDQLRRRELQKQRKFRVLVALASIAVVAVLIAAIMFQVSAQQRRSSGETLVAVKLNELRTLLNVKQDPEELSMLNDWDETSLALLISSSGTDKAALVDAAMSLRGQGIKNWQAGAMETAMDNFKESWALFAENYRRDRNDHGLFFELGQAEYWIGQVHWDRGQLDQAEPYFMSYAEITRRLILLQPENAEWVLEMSYALSNLGGIQRDRGASNPVRALQLMQSALEYNQLALVLDPTNAVYRSELGQSYANLADARHDVCDLEGALESQQENITLQSELLQADSTNTGRMGLLAYALSGHAKIQQMLGQAEESKPNLEKSLQLIGEVLVQKPTDQTTLRYILVRKQRLAWLSAMTGNSKQAWLASNAMEAQWQSLLQVSDADDIRTIKDYAIYLIDRSRLAHNQSNPGIAMQALDDSMELLVTVVRNLPDNRSVGNLLTLAVFQYWEIKHELPSADILGLLPEYSAGGGRIRACIDASMAFRKALMLGDKTQAGELASYLLEHGFRETSFILSCNDYALCTGQ